MFFWYQADQARKEIESLQAQRTVDFYKATRQHSLFATQQQQYASAERVLADTYKLDEFIGYPPSKHSRNLVAKLISTVYSPAQHNYGYPDIDVILNTLAYHPEKQLLAVAGEQGKIFLFDTKKGFLNE